MMPRYVDTEDFKHLINASSLYDTEEWVKVMVLLADTPTANVRENVHGGWLDHQNGRWIYAKCSICGTIHDTKTNFCPNCGADMRERKEDEA